MEIVERSRRRIDRVTAPDYLDDLGRRPTSDIRQMRNDCREEETRLSYLRRLVQGRLDIARAELARRAGNGDDLLGVLPAILADSPQEGPRQARVSPMFEPTEPGERSEDRALDDASVGTLPELSDEQLDDLVGRFAAQERELSELRRTVLRHLDQLQSELVSRYRDGQAQVEEALAEGDPQLEGGR